MLLLAASAWAQQPEQIDEQVIDWINTNARALTPFCSPPIAQLHSPNTNGRWLLTPRGEQIARTVGLPGSYGSACQIVQRHNPGDLFLACEDRQPANASLPHELFSLFDVLVLKAANEVATHVMAHGRRVGVMPVSGGPDGNIAIGHHSHQPLTFANWQRAHVQ